MASEEVNYLKGLPPPDSDFNTFSEEERIEIEAKLTLDAIQRNRRYRKAGFPERQEPIPFRIPPDGRLVPVGYVFPSREEMIDQLCQCEEELLTAEASLGSVVDH
jgi:hypothetical protein